MNATGSLTTNPAGSPSFKMVTIPAIKPPSEEVQAKQDPEHTEDDFDRDLKTATERKSEAS